MFGMRFQNLTDQIMGSDLAKAVQMTFEDVTYAHQRMVDEIHNVTAYVQHSWQGSKTQGLINYFPEPDVREKATSSPPPPAPNPVKVDTAEKQALLDKHVAKMDKKLGLTDKKSTSVFIDPTKQPETPTDAMANAIFEQFFGKTSSD